MLLNIIYRAKSSPGSWTRHQMRARAGPGTARSLAPNLIRHTYNNYNIIIGKYGFRVPPQQTNQLSAFIGLSGIREA